MKNYFLPALLFICLCMTGCSGAGASKANNYNQFTKDEVNISSLAKRPVMVQLGGNKSQVVYEVIDISSDTREGKLYSYDLESRQFETLELEGSSKLQDGQLYGCMNETGELFLVDGESLFVYHENKLDSTIALEQLDGFQCQTITSFQCDEKFLYLTNAEGELLILNSGMDILLHERDYMAVLCPNTDDKCRLFVTGNVESGIYYFDAGQKKLVKENAAKMKKEEVQNLFSASIVSGDKDYDFYYYDKNWQDDQIVLVGVKNGKAVQILNFADLNIYPDDIQKVHPDGRGGFIVHTYSMDSVNGAVWRFFTLEKTDTKKSRTESTEKTEINFAGINIPNEFEKVVFDFNQASDSYIIKYKDYSDNNSDADTARKKLYLDMVEKGAIDGLLLGNLSKSDLMEKGMLAEFNTYFETSGEISLEALMPCVLESITEENGKIYSVYPEFTVKAFISKEEQDFSSFGEYADYLEQGKAVFAEQDGTAVLNRLLV